MQAIIICWKLSKSSLCSTDQSSLIDSNAESSPPSFSPGGTMPHVPRSLAPFARVESETFKGHAGSDLSRSHVSRHVRSHVAAHMSLRLRGGLSSSVRVFMYVEDGKRAEITSERSSVIQAHRQLWLAQVRMETLWPVTYWRKVSCNTLDLWFLLFFPRCSPLLLSAFVWVKALGSNPLMEMRVWKYALDFTRECLGVMA